MAAVVRPDRTLHELRGITDFFLGRGNVGSIEPLARRVQAIIDAYAQDARTPKWTIARHFRGAHGMNYGVDPSLQAAVHRRGREENVVHSHSRGATAAGGRGGRRGDTGEMGRLEQAESVGRGSASCSGPRGDCVEPIGRVGRVRQRRSSGCAKIRTTNEALNSLAVSKDTLEKASIKCKKEVRVRCLALPPFFE